MIPIDKNAKFKIEDNNYILYRKIQDSKAKDEKSKWLISGYFPTLDSLLQDWVKNAPAWTQDSLRTLQDVVDVIQKAEKRVEQLIHNN